MAGCWEKEGMAGLCNCCRQVEGMRWREGGRETGSRREGRAEREICGDYSVSTRPEQREPRGQSPPPPSGPAKRAGTRRLVAVSATRNGAILDHEGVWVAGCERGWGGVVGGADGKQAGNTGRTGRETAEGATEGRAGTKDERKTNGERILAPHWQPGTRGPKNQPSVSSNPIQTQGRCDHKEGQRVGDGE